ncbi:6703_t:CDS:2, partial [Scutellospora calospora]
FRNNSFIVAIIKSFPNLKYFDISSNDIRDEVVEVVASICYELEYLDLRGYRFITELLSNSESSDTSDSDLMTTHRAGGENTSNKQNLEENPISSYLLLSNPIFTGFLGISMCSNKLLKKIGSIISRKLTSKKKNSKFVKEETTALLGFTIILSIFISNIKNNTCLSNKKSIMILTEVLIEKSNPKTLNYILLSNNWFYSRKYNNDELQTYISEIVINTEDAFPRAIILVNKRDIHDFYKILPRKSKDLLYRRLNIFTTSDLSTSNIDFISSLRIEVIYMKHPILKRKVKSKINYQAL